MATVLDAHKLFKDIKSADLAKSIGKYAERFCVWYGGTKKPILRLLAKNVDDYVGASNRMMHFNLYAEGGAAKLVHHKGATWLVHDGRVSHRRDAGLPGNGFETVLVGGRLHYLIASIESGDLFERMVEYHLSRSESTTKIGQRKSKPGNYSGQNGGADGAFRAEAADKNPLHNSVVDALRAAIPGDWKNIDKNAVAPDLFIKNGKYRILFEIKPSSDFSNMCHAVGQLLYYSKYLKCTKKVFVAFGIPNTLDRHLENLSSFGISFLEAQSQKTNDLNSYTFPKLAQILAKD